MFDKEMMDALRADAEKLGHLTGEDHTPEFLADCEACGSLRNNAMFDKEMMDALIDQLTATIH